ncbi:MAG: SMC-Scp complex subunit ScpB [Bacteroidetes bacterium]|nr:SMC-Scp complex subunit ScpB [Bacteroidota bacterium]
MSEQRPGKSVHGLSVIIEAMLFASDEPMSSKQLVEILTLPESEPRQKKVSPQAIESIIHTLNEEYEKSGRVFRIVPIAGGYQFATRPEYGVWLGAMMKERSRRKLSISALESLAVIAYKQPVTKPELEAIRGVNADYVLRSLLERGLITIVGRAATPGRPLLYGTTRDFLKHFGVNDLSDLPKPREIDELLEEAEYEVEKKLIREQQLANGEGETDSPGTVPSPGTDDLRV